MTVAAPIYDSEGITIYNGSAFDLLPQLQADVIVTDPPYGIAHPTDYHTRGRGKLAACSDYPPVFGDREPFDPGALLAVKVPTILWGANYFADKLPTSSGWLVWDKMRPHTLDQATAELAWSNFVKGCRVFRHMWNGMIRASERGRGVLVHPTQKPIALMEWCLTLKWTPRGVVLDPFMGAGSTLLAARNLGRPAIGIEISEQYCALAISRLENQGKEETK